MNRASWKRGAALSLALLFADQLTKWIARSTGIAVPNYGASFSMFSDHPHAALGLSIAASSACVVCLVFARRRPLGLFMLAAGVVGNLIDRVVSGHVVDWIHLPIIDIAVNMADIWICMGALFTFNYLKKEL